MPTMGMKNNTSSQAMVLAGCLLSSSMVIIMAMSMRT